MSKHEELEGILNIIVNSGLKPHYKVAKIKELFVSFNT